MKTYEIVWRIVWSDGRNFFSDKEEFISEEYLADYLKSELEEYDSEGIQVTLYSVTEIERTPIDLKELGL